MDAGPRGKLSNNYAVSVARESVILIKINAEAAEAAVVVAVAAYCNSVDENAANGDAN